MDILKKFDKNLDISENCKLLISNIEIFQKNNEYLKWKILIKKVTKLDDKIIDNRVSKIFLDNFNFSKNSYSKNIISFWNFPKQILYFIVIFFLNFFFKKINNNKKNKFNLLIDNIMSSDQMPRYYRLIEFFEKKNVFIRTTNQQVVLDGYNYYYYPKVLNYNFKINDILLLIKIFFLNIKLILKFKINFFYLSTKILNEYYWYENFFEKFKFKNIIMHQHYFSNNIKNFVFKKKGGINSALIQKNINILNTNGFFYDADLLFTFSKKASINKKKTFSRINSIVETGSFFMENFSNELKDINFKKNNFDTIFDVICIGGNDLFPGNSYYDSYKTYPDDYNLHLEWLKKISIEFPDLKVGFKHHGNNKHLYEENYLKDSNVVMINQKLNSYNLAFSSNFVCSWASTMIIEMTAYNKFCYFLDPGLRNNQFLSEIIDSKTLRIKDYEEFIKKFNDAKKNKFYNFYEPYCVNSENVSKKIYSILKSNIITNEKN